MPAGDSYVKGYMLTGQTVNRLLDKAEASTKSFFRKTRRIAKDFDDLLMLGMARAEKGTNEAVEEEVNDEAVGEEEPE